ncbi:CHAT domain-containing protein [Cryomorpha ignava]|uniref:CHAT domain-containing protein n=1 Tax=Cryomorpha ignava TaxID=101383 RepID=A0A7K3WS10_9FLAO|nr:CHAT domain-containing protein [Cryomorpha ignava]NEN24457.1 CHAT domain-containing protein [Cryomorpha ignava]
MKITALKRILLFTFSVMMISSNAQEFDESLFFSQKDKIDSLLASEKYTEAIKAIEIQIIYLKYTARYDSLKLYTYDLGHAYLSVKKVNQAMRRTELLVDFIEEKVANKSVLLDAISDLSWIYIEAGEDSLCFENDKRYLSVCEVYPNASALEKSTAHYSLGFDYQMLYGNAKKAIYHFEMALNPVEKDSLNYTKRMMECLNALGAVFFRNGEYAKSQTYLYRGLAFSEFLPDTVDRFRHQANIYGNLSLGFQDEGNLVKSKDFLNHAIEIRKQLLETEPPGYQKSQQERLLISNYHNLAALYLSIGDISKSEQISKYVQKLRQKYLVADHPDHKKSLEAFGSIQFALGEYDQALANFEKYLAGDIADYGMNSYYTAIGYERVSKVLFNQGDYLGAVKNYTQSINIGKKITDEFSGQELAKGYLMRAQAYEALQDYESAESDIRQARKIYLNTLPGNSPIIGKLFTQLANLKCERNQLDSAQYYVDMALAIFLEKQSEQVSLYQTRLSQFTSFISEAYLTKAKIILNQNSDIESEKEALEFLETAIIYLQKTSGLYTDEADLLTFYNEHQRIFEKTQEITYSLYHQTGDEIYLNKFLAFEEESKSLLLRRQLGKFTSLRVTSVPDSIITRERILQREMSGAIEPNDDSRDIINIEAEYDQIIDLIQKKYPDYYNLRFSTFIVNADDIKRELIKPGQNIIQYMMTDTSVFAIVLNEKNTQLLKFDAPDLRKELQNLNTAITSLNQNDFYKSSAYLYTTIFEPIEKYLDGSELFIIPDQDLFNINFEALIKPSERKEPHYLIYDYTISYLISSTTAYQYKNLKRSQSNGLLAFAPGFSDDLKSDYVNHLKDSSLFDINYMKRIQQPFAVEAASDAAGIFSGRSFVSNQATEHNFKSQAEKYKIIHFGTHTEINNISPLLSRLVLSKASDTDSEEDDGYLHVYEIYNTPLRAELAVLTACETGIGKTSASEGMLSLAHGFAYAGCPSIVMSLWQIDEKTSAAISHEFYKKLASGVPKNQALRQAKISFIKSNSSELSAPYYWSGMVLLGDVSPITNSSGSNNPMWLFALVILAVLLITSLFVVKQYKL